MDFLSELIIVATLSSLSDSKWSIKFTLIFSFLDLTVDGVFRDDDSEFSSTSSNYSFRFLLCLLVTTGSNITDYDRLLSIL